MQSDATPKDGTSTISSGTRKRLETLLYASGRCADGQVLLRFVRTTLDRPDLTHRNVLDVSEEEAERLIATFQVRFPDRSAGIAASVIDRLV